MTINWEYLDEWKTHLFHKNSPVNEFGQFQSFKQLWDDKRTGDLLPAWSDFKFNDFEPWWGWLTVEDIIPSPSYDTVYRLFGTDVAELYGDDFTGKRLSDLDGFLTPEDAEIAKLMIADQLICIQTGPMKWKNRSYNIFSFIELPLADNGQDVDKILSLVSTAVTPDLK